MENSKISWCHHTHNVGWHCVEVSPGCDHCYARTLAERYGFNVWGKNADARRLSDTYWKQPLKWEKRASETGERERVFCSSMADVFENHPVINVEREKLWTLIAATPHLDWLLLTKRPGNILRFMPSDRTWPNVRLGTSAENQFWFDVRWPQLAKAVGIIACAGTMVSLEPLLGYIDISQAVTGATKLGWALVGGE